ncbi:hypothetical protein C8A01DRAFT_41789 [Parachaetomium inaequale]|uniref:Secreted protein n=1 Tax=Parachaetomium inaequale TaxID=2588326 RepID=A0AAN6SLI8_9PEZI|nr:hypothetical protein C8A01DRAFT_41789 [Parachaetomium inaequale]
MKALILVKRLRLCHVLVRLPCLLSTFPLHKQFQAAVIQPPVATDLLYQELFLPAVVANHWGERPRTVVNMTSWFMHRDPVAFPDPETFDLERWLDVKRAHFRDKFLLRP